jgi:hypothetical protein
MWAIVATTALVVVTVGGAGLFRQNNISRRENFWEPLLRTDHPILVLVGKSDKPAQIDPNPPTMVMDRDSVDL